MVISMASILYDCPNHIPVSVPASFQRPLCHLPLPESLCLYGLYGWVFVKSGGGSVKSGQMDYDKLLRFYLDGQFFNLLIILQGSVFEEIVCCVEITSASSSPPPS